MGPNQALKKCCFLFILCVREPNREPIFRVMPRKRAACSLFFVNTRLIAAGVFSVVGLQVGSLAADRAPGILFLL